MEKLKPTTTAEMPPLKERGLVTEMSALRNDWLKANAVALEDKKASELKKAIESFYTEVGPAIKEALEQKGVSLEGNLRQLARQHLDASDLQKVREQLALPKWVPLAEAVAFIKTAIDVGEGDVKAKYAEYCAETFSLDDMRATLAFDNDVKPARIDTDIYNQSPERSRSAVEIVSNAIDALNPEQNSIGRFGVGFYQILAHLKDGHDFVEVKTGNEQTGFYNIGFRIKNGEIQVSLTADREAMAKGTTVRLHSKDFPKAEADALVRRHFAYNDVAQVTCNGELVNDVKKFGTQHREKVSISYESSADGFAVRDEGIGMSPQVILEKLLVPKFSGKRSVHELAKEASVAGNYLVERRTPEHMHEQGTVAVNVGGVMIEEISLKGIHTPKTLVVNLPPFTTLGEERNEVAIDEITIKSAKDVIDKIMATNDPELINALAPLIESFQRRSLQHAKEDNLVSYLQDKGEETLLSDAYYLPNAPGFERLQLERTILLDPAVRKTHWNHVPGLTALSTKGDGKAVFVAPLAEKTDDPTIAWKNQVIFDASLYEQYKKDPTLINVFLRAHGKAEGVDIREIASKQEKHAEISGERSLETYRDINEFVEQNWATIGFDNVNQARAYIKRQEPMLTPEVKQTVNGIVNAFPATISAYFVGAALEGKLKGDAIEATKNFISFAQNPDLVSSLAVAGIHGLHVKEIEPEVFPRIDNYKKGKWSHLSFGLCEETGQDWYNVKYWNRENLIAANGRVYPGKAASVKGLMRSGLAFGYIPLYDEDTKETAFLDPKTGVISKTLRNTKDNVRAFTFGGRRLYLNEYRAHDFDTGELFPLLPEEMYGNLYHSGENFIYLGGRGYLLPDGTIISSEEFNERKNLRDREANPDKPAIVSHPDRVELCLGMRVIYTKFRDASNERAQEIYKHEKMTGSLFESDGNTFILESYAKNEYGWRLDFPEQNELELKLLTPDGNDVLHLEYKDYRGNISWDVVQTTDGSKALRIQEYGRGKKTEGNDSKELAPTEVRYFNTRGQELHGDQLKVMPPLSFRLVESYDRGSLSSYQPEAWRAEIKVERNSNGYPLQNIQLTNSVTNQPLFSERFQSVEYDPAENVWRCMHLEPAIIPPLERQFDLRKRSVYKVAIIDSEGNLLREEEAIPNDTSFFLDAAYRWDEDWRGRGRGRDRMPLEGTQPVSYEKTALMNRAIHSLDQADRDVVERLVNRSLRFASLSDGSFGKVAPTLAQVEYLDERLLTEERIQNIAARLQEFDEGTPVWCYRFLSQMLQSRAHATEIDAFTEKFLLVFREKIAQLPETEKQQMYDSFSQLRDYNKEWLATGWTIVQYKTPVPIGQIPEKIRAVVDFLRSDQSDNLTQSRERILLNDAHQVTLAQLIQAKRLNERAIQNFEGTAQELEQIVQEKTSGKSQEHIRREIIHPIYYQSVNNPYLFIRELIQNGHDIALKSANPLDKRIIFDVFSRQNDEVTVRIEDRGGMRLQDVVNYFLIPGESTKIGDEESIGYFGQGVFTLFRDAKEVVLQTSVGDGIVSKLRIAPQRNESGMIVDLAIQIAQESGDFKGTIIEKTLDTSSPTVEGAFIKNAASTYASLVDGNAVNIFLNGQQLNRPQGKLSELEVPGIGTFAMYDAPNNVITQRGLYVKTIDSDFKTKMQDVEQLLEKRGVVISIPDTIALTRSRNEIARKQEFLPALQEYLPLLKLKAYLEIFRQDIEKGHVIQLDNLPYDYYYEFDRTSRKVLDDAKLLREGKPITDVRNYLEHGKLVELLVHLPVVEVDDKTYSITELKNAALHYRAPLNNEDGWRKIPKVLREKLSEGRREHGAMTDSRRRDEEEHQKVEDFSLQEYHQQPKFVQDKIEKNLAGFQAMDTKIKSLNGSLSQFIPTFNDTRNTYYYESVSSLAHASALANLIGWNLKHLQDYKINYFNTPDVSDSNIRDFYETYSHECAHLVERGGEFTHNQQFYRQQARVLSFLMYAKRKEKA